MPSFVADVRAGGSAIARGLMKGGKRHGEPFRRADFEGQVVSLDAGRQCWGRGHEALVVMVESGRLPAALMEGSVMVTVLIEVRHGYTHVEAFDADGAGLLFLMPAFATDRDAEMYALGELERLGIDLASIVIDRPAE